MPALAIVNDVLLDGMKVVGDLFGSGEMQLPFVLQSAETMKAAVSHLEPHMEKADSAGKGTIVLATVRGDVHDIGKNLVDIILSNNGYVVHNLGIKIGIAEMIEKSVEVAADAIGMSGLLVKSTIIMRENLEELNTRGLAETPVMLGGAALTRTYVEVDLRQVYDGRVFYGKDAFEGLHTMDRLMAMKRSGDWDAAFGRELGGRNLPPRKSQREIEAVEVYRVGVHDNARRRHCVREPADDDRHRPGIAAPFARCGLLLGWALGRRCGRGGRGAGGAEQRGSEPEAEKESAHGRRAPMARVAP